MTHQILFLVSMAAIAVACAVAARWTLRQPLRPFARNLLLFAIGAELVIAALHIVSNVVPMPGYVAWFLNLKYERNLGAMFSSLQLMLIAVLALAVALRQPGITRGQRLYWLLVTALFAYLSLDEFFSIHETFGGRVPTSDYLIPYAIAGGLFMLVSLAAYWLHFRGQWRFFALLLGGLIILAMGAVAVEEFVEEGFIDNNPGLIWMSVFEELTEMIGATIALAGVVGYAQQHLTDRSWPVARRLVPVGGVIWIAVMLFAIFVLPAIDARANAEAVQVDYGNGELTLVGYQVSPAVVHPADEIALTLYWRANRPVTTDYSVSVHVVRHPEIASLTQSDDLHVGPIPSSAWIPGVINARTLYVQLPRNLPTPASHWLTLRVWSGPWPFGRPWSDTIGLKIDQSENRALLADDTVILASVPALPTAPPDPLPTPATYRFGANLFTLTGYDLPDVVQTHTLPVAFAWNVASRPDRDLTQFFHLVPESATEVFAYDQPPFGGSFPTADWPAGMNAVDEWRIRLPDTLEPGRYDVYTGMYDPVTVERVPVVDGSGQPTQDNAISLGTIEFAPDPEVEAALANAVENVCYGVSDTNARTQSENDTLVVMNTDTGDVTEIGPTGSIKTEGVTFSADRSVLYGADEREDRAQFGAFDLQTGAFMPIGDGLATPDNPARNPVFGDNVLKDIDSVSLDPTTGILWGIHQDEENLLFQIDPERGEIIRDAFGTGYDYIRIDLGALPDADPDYVNVKDLAIHPTDGTFYVTVGSDAFEALLARLDFDTLSLDDGTLPAIAVTPFVSSEGEPPIRDVEGLSFAPDGTLYAISSNNSNAPEHFDRLWRVDPETGQSTPIGRFGDFVDAVDYEAIACGTRPVSQSQAR